MFDYNCKDTASFQCRIRKRINSSKSKKKGNSPEVDYTPGEEMYQKIDYNNNNNNSNDNKSSAEAIHPAERLSYTTVRSSSVRKRRDETENQKNQLISSIQTDSKDGKIIRKNSKKGLNWKAFDIYNIGLLQIAHSRLVDMILQTIHDSAASRNVQNLVHLVKNILNTSTWMYILQVY